LVLLGLLPSGNSRVDLHHDGFRDTSFAIALGPADTVPVTVLLRPLSLADTARCR
jgi:hypothetical protein